MISIKASVEIAAPIERVWTIVSDVDRDSEYWTGLNSVDTTERNENVIERDVHVGFMGQKAHQILRVKPKESIDLTMTDGPLVGSRKLRLAPIGNSKTNLEALWEFQFSKVPVFAKGFVKAQIENVTKEALEKIALEAEGAQRKKVVVLVTASEGI